MSDNPDEVARLEQAAAAAAASNQDDTDCDPKKRPGVADDATQNSSKRAKPSTSDEEAKGVIEGVFDAGIASIQEIFK